MTANTMNKILKAVNHAREKHPVFAGSLYQAVSIASEELGEMAKAINDKDEEQTEAEALDTIAVLVRIIEDF